MGVVFMANYQRYEDNIYVYGNTVRKENTLPRERRIDERRVHENVRRKRNKQAQMSLPYTLFLVAAVVVSLFVCVQYINVRADITNSLEEITRLERQLSEMKEDNDIAYNRVLTSVDLNEIKRIAMEEYGMIYAGDNQIITYETDNDDYMHQYKNLTK